MRTGAVEMGLAHLEATAPVVAMHVECSAHAESEETSLRTSGDHRAQLGRASIHVHSGRLSPLCALSDAAIPVAGHTVGSAAPLLAATSRSSEGAAVVHDGTTEARLRGGGEEAA